MTRQHGSSGESRTAEDRIIAAEVALKEHLPGVARLFLAGISRRSLTAATNAVQARFLRVAQASRILVCLAVLTA